MLKKAVALSSLMGLFSSLFLFQGLAFASTDTPDYLIWQDNLQNVRWDVSALLGNEPVPLGGLQNEYLFIGSDEPFYGVEITMENGSADGEFEFKYYPDGSGPFPLDNPVNLNSLEGTVEASWTADDMGNWQTVFVSDAPYGATETSMNVITDVYGVLLSTNADSSNEQVLTASDIRLITTEPERTIVTSASTGEALSHNGELTFSDVPQGYDSTVKIEFLVADGVFKGYEDGTFQPERSISRAELAKVVVAGTGVDPAAVGYTSNCFPDAQQGDWWEPYVCYALDQGWVKGYDDGTFGPHRTVNRAEAAKIFVNVMEFGDPENVPDHYVSLLPDVNADDWFAGYVTTLSSAIVVPNSEAYNPAEGMTRESTAEFLFNIRALQETGQSYYNTDVREDFLQLYGLETLIDLAYVKSTGGGGSSTSTYENVSVHFGDCNNMNVRVTNYSGFEIDLTGWTVIADSMNNNTEVSPFNGVTLADGESVEVTASGYFAYTDSNNVTTTGVTLEDDNGSIKAGGFCTN